MFISFFLLLSLFGRAYQKMCFDRSDMGFAIFVGYDNDFDDYHDYLGEGWVYCL